MNRYLSKSRFKIALECPTKLDYVGRKEYVDTKKGNDFLKSLAEGGFQVGELAKLIYPEGVEVVDVNQQDQIERTKQLLRLNDVTIFEGTVQFGDWVARVDIIRKTGNQIELIEVKSKSYDSRLGSSEIQWRNKTGLKEINSKILPYLQDIAFQSMLFRAAFPAWGVTEYLMMPDKAEVSSIDGLNQKFKIYKSGTGDRQRSWSEKVPGTTLESVGNPLLKAVNVNTFVKEIIDGTIKTPEGTQAFKKSAIEWASAYAENSRIKAIVGKHCRDCEFYCDRSDDTQKSGFHHCWSEATGKSFEQIVQNRPITNLYHPAKGQLENLIAQRGLWLSDLEETDFDLSEDFEGMTRKYRQYLQVFGSWNDTKPFEFDSAFWKQVVSTFTYPLHFIDFEGARPALPFVAGKRPYSQVAFQFSHHVVNRDGSVVHASEFLDLTPGQDPSIDFLRALKAALCAPGYETGTVLMWSHYENIVLNGLRSDLMELIEKGGGPSDAEDLINFVESLTARKDENGKVIRGERMMIDLYVIAGKCFFHPDTMGRSSIKVVLPAVMKSSQWLKEVYSKPIYGNKTGIESRNFPLRGEPGMVWWVADRQGVMNPYQLLPPIFEDMSQAEMDNMDLSDGEDIREGGAATTAYARMQFAEASDKLREATRKALLRYCELDTLAMVMIYQAWTAWTAE